MDYRYYMDKKTQMAAAMTELSGVCRAYELAENNHIYPAELTGAQQAQMKLEYLRKTPEYDHFAVALNDYLIYPFRKNRDVVKTIMDMSGMCDEEDLYQECLMRILAKMPAEVSRIKGECSTRKGQVVRGEGYVLYLDRMVANHLVDIGRKYHWKFGRTAQKKTGESGQKQEETRLADIINKRKTVSLETEINDDGVMLKEIIPGEANSAEQMVVQKQLREALSAVLKDACIQTQKRLSSPLDLIMLKVVYSELLGGSRVPFRDLEIAGYTAEQQRAAKRKAKKVLFGILRQQLEDWH